MRNRQIITAILTFLAALAIGFLVARLLFG
jgi:hypothetical protein